MASATIRKLIGCVKMNNFIFLKGSRVQSVTIRRLIGIAIIATGILQLDFPAKNVEKKHDCYSILIIVAIIEIYFIRTKIDIKAIILMFKNKK